jgi:hypothetical protein
MIIRKFPITLLATMMVVLWAAEAGASPPMAPADIAVIAETLPACTGGWWYNNGTPEGKKIGPADLLPRVALLANPSLQLDDRAGDDLYAIAKALLLPAVDPSSWSVDASSSLKCPAKPKEAVALLAYLAGDGPNEWRGVLNVFDWLGFAYETGAGGVRDARKARQYYLLSRIYSTFPKHDGWSDGIDNSLIANINRAGLRPYLEAVARSDRFAATARLILADEALPTNPPMARSLLLYPDVATLTRLLALEDQGRLPVATDGSDIGVWAEGWRTAYSYNKWAARLLKSVILVNGGAVPTSSERPTIAGLRPHLDMGVVADTYATLRPIALRALVNREGRAIYVEACQSTPRTGDASGSTLNVFLDAARMYNLIRLPKLPIPRISGRPAFGWVILPAVQFQRDEHEKLISFADLPAEQCAFSAMTVLPRMAVATSTEQR